MLLRNFINTMIPTPSSVGGVNLHTTGGTWSTIKPDCSGGTRGSAPYYFYHIGRTGSGSTDYRSAIAIAIGKGTTPPVLDDYLLENPITSGLTSLGLSNNVYGNTEYLLSSGMTFSETLYNGDSANVEISEIGLLSCASSDKYGCDLLTRDVLTTPIVIKPGEAKTITVNIDFTQMSTNVAAS